MSDRHSAVERTAREPPRPQGSRITPGAFRWCSRSEARASAGQVHQPGARPIALPTGTATIEHRGRKSGKPYQTVTAIPQDLVCWRSLAHGKTDWVKSVLAAGENRRALRPRRCSSSTSCAAGSDGQGAAADGVAAPDQGLRRRYLLTWAPTDVRTVCGPRWRAKVE